MRRIQASQPPGQEPVTREREQHAWRRQDHGAGMVKHGDPGADEKQRSGEPAEESYERPECDLVYAYGPPVNDTRLPASAMQITMRPIAMAQRR